MTVSNHDRSPIVQPTALSQPPLHEHKPLPLPSAPMPTGPPMCYPRSPDSQDLPMPSLARVTGQDMGPGEGIYDHYNHQHDHDQHIPDLTPDDHDVPETDLNIPIPMTTLYDIIDPVTDSNDND